MAISFGHLFRKYCLVTLFPTFVVSSIYADYTHTQKYKAQLKQENVSDHT